MVLVLYLIALSCCRVLSLLSLLVFVLGECNRLRYDVSLIVLLFYLLIPFAVRVLSSLRVLMFSSLLCLERLVLFLRICHFSIVLPSGSFCERRRMVHAFAYILLLRDLRLVCSRLVG